MAKRKVTVTDETKAEVTKELVPDKEAPVELNPDHLSWEEIATVIPAQDIAQLIAEGLVQHNIYTYEDLKKNVGPASAIIRKVFQAEYSALLARARMEANK